MEGGSMERNPRPDRKVRRSARLRFPLLLAAITALAVPAGFAFAQSTQSTEPSGSPADWSQANWIAHDPALDPAAWKGARYVQVDCPSTVEGGKCWEAQGFPKINHDAPMPWPERKMWCEESLSPSESAIDPECRAQAIPESSPPDVKAELEAYGVDRAYGAAGKR
jgi:hypothetical protein